MPSSVHCLLLKTVWENGTREFSLNSEGEVEVAVEQKNGVESGKPNITSKMSPGSTFEIMEESGVPKLKGEMPLYLDSIGGNSRQGRLLTVNDVDERYYMGRDPETKDAVYLEAVTSDARVELLRTLDKSVEDGKTMIIGKSGSSRIHRGWIVFLLVGAKLGRFSTVLDAFIGSWQQSVNVSN